MALSDYHASLPSSTPQPILALSYDSFIATLQIIGKECTNLPFLRASVDFAVVTTDPYTTHLGYNTFIDRKRDCYVVYGGEERAQYSLVSLTAAELQTADYAPGLTFQTHKGAWSVVALVTLLSHF
jgi:hypothetical protein